MQRREYPGRKSGTALREYREGDRSIQRIGPNRLEFETNVKTFKSHGQFKLVRDITAVYDVEVSVGRGAVAGFDEGDPLDRARRRVSRQKKQLNQMRRRLAQSQQQAANQKRRVQLLQSELLQARTGSTGEGKLESLGQPSSIATGDAATNGEERPGMGFRPGDPHYRSWVGQPKQYDVKAAIQVSLLMAAGLRETHRLVEVGCGSLRAGRLFIPYLLPGNYYGIEPNQWVVEEGIRNELGEGILEIKRPNFRFVDDFSADGFRVEFDFALAQSVFSHTYPEMTLAGLKGMSKALAPDGRIFANFVEGGETSEDGTGWVYPECTTHTWEKMGALLAECNLVGRKLDWVQNMQWFVAARPEHEDEIDDFAQRLHPPLEGTSNQVGF